MNKKTLVILVVFVIILIVIVGINIFIADREDKTSFSLSVEPRKSLPRPGAIVEDQNINFYQDKDKTEVIEEKFTDQPMLLN